MEKIKSIFIEAYRLPRFGLLRNLCKAKRCFLPIKKNLTSLLMLGLMTVGAGCVSLNQDKIASLESTNTALLARINESQKQNLILKEQKEALSKELRAAASERESERHQVELLQSRLNTLEAKWQREETKHNDLEIAKTALEDKLKTELQKYQAKLEISERGLIVSILAEVLFDSGSAELKPSAYEILEKVGLALSSNLHGNRVAIEGYTDNDPIKYSDWESNWELSAARALSVLHYFLDEKKMDADKITAVAYGEFSPRASNATIEGKRQNRRVEIVISPNLVKEPGNNLITSK